MIAVVFGTTGELIKLAPVLRRLEDRRQTLLRLSTGQQVEQIPPMLDDFGLAQPDVWLGRGYRGGDLERPREIPVWFAQVLGSFARRRREIASRLAADDSPPLLIVHGDTMTTLAGAAMGRLLRVPVAHIEAGMRSGSWRNPFPEELNRKGTARLAHIHFAPGDRAVRNLRAESVRGKIVDTRHNTVADNVHDVTGRIPPGVPAPAGQFGLVSLHRQELLYNREALSEIVRGLRDSAARDRPMLFIDHPITAAAVEVAGLASLFDRERFVRIPRQPYFRFLSLLKASSFLVTDSGGSQEECAFMGHPCLIHRSVTEHDTGLGGSVLLSRLDMEAVRGFLGDPDRFRHPPVSVSESPSDSVVRFLEDQGFLRDSPEAPVTTSHRQLGTS
jgi:UDP-N-acetylglucosamine 2-epimerase (non-hydrolysing)